MGEEEAGDRYHDDDQDLWSSPPVVVCKGKRSKRQRVHAAPPPPPAEVVVIVAASAEAESSSADDRCRSGAEEEQEEEDMALCLMLLARGGRGGPSFAAPDAAAAESTAKEGRFRSRRPADGGGAGEFVYECRTCGRCFPSFQALGGHRTSHKKPRLLLLSDEKKRQPAVDEEKRTPPLSPSPPSPAPRSSADPTVLAAIPAVPATPPKHEASIAMIHVSRRRQQQQGRVHECSICGSEFASGQALGGHMRRHRPLVVPASTASSSDDLAISKIKEKSLLELDLNMPAPCDDTSETTSPAAAMLFPAPASALVDCHY